MRKASVYLVLVFSVVVFISMGLILHANQDVSKERQEETIRADGTYKLDFLSPLEKGVIIELNRIRAHPKAYVEILKEMRKHYDGLTLQKEDGTLILTGEGVIAVDDAIAFLEDQESLGPFLVSKGLCNAARVHVNDQGLKGLLGHKGSDGSTPTDRIKRFHFTENLFAENINYGCETARDIVLFLVIDDNVKDRGHRKTIFNPDYKKVGVACGPHHTYETMCVIDFAGNYIEI